MFDYKKHIYELDVFGFTIVKKVISKEYAQIFKQKLIEAETIEKEKFKDNPHYGNWHLLNLCTCDNFFLDFLDNEVMYKMYSHFLGQSCILYTYCSTTVYPDRITRNHEIHNDAPKSIPNYISGLQMTMALDDFTHENGASLYLPGSHRMSEKPCDETFYKYAVKVARESGDVLFFNPSVWHKAGENKTDKIRYGFSTYAVRSFMKQRFDFPRIIAEETAQGLSERVKGFLGYNVRIPVTLEDFFVDPEKRLYKPNQD